MFKVGDLVRCVDGFDPGSHPEQGRVYQVVVVDPNGFVGVGHDHRAEWDSDRFEPVAEARGTGPVQGMKYDSGKTRLSLLDKFSPLLWGVAAIMEFGAAKYAEDSWRDVPDALRRYRDARDRHWRALMDGEETDGESGKPHVWHWLCDSLFMAWLVVNKPELLKAERERVS